MGEREEKEKKKKEVKNCQELERVGENVYQPPLLFIPHRKRGPFFLSPSLPLKRKTEEGKLKTFRIIPFSLGIPVK